MIKNISIIISSSDHPINTIVEEWVSYKNNNFDIEIVRKPNDLVGGDLLFLISCVDIIPPEILNKYKKSLVIHASNLPKGRGFSPHIWDILDDNESRIGKFLPTLQDIETFSFRDLENLDLYSAGFIIGAVDSSRAIINRTRVLGMANIYSFYQNII